MVAGGKWFNEIIGGHAMGLAVAGSLAFFFFYCSVLGPSLELMLLSVRLQSSHTTICSMKFSDWISHEDLILTLSGSGPFCS